MILVRLQEENPRMKLDPQEPMEALKRVTSIVRQFLPRRFDTESVAVDILIESWSNQVERPSWEFIKNRCYDQLRKAGRERVMLDQKSRESNPDHSDETIIHQRNLVGALVKILTPHERKLVFYRFYLDLPLNEIATRLDTDVNQVRETLTNALFKMRQEAWE